MPKPRAKKDSKKIKVGDRVVIDGAERLGTFYVYAVTAEHAEIMSSHNPIPLEELKQPNERHTTVGKTKQVRLKALRQRRESLNSDDGNEITNSSTRFKLETEIFHLEREIDIDEWPEVILA